MSGSSEASLHRLLLSAALLVVLTCAVVLRADHLAARSMWFDESVSYTTITRFSWSEIVERTAQAVHPPFYYMLLRVWAAGFGTSLVALRAFSVAMGGATVFGAYLFCRDAFAEPVGRGSSTSDRWRGVAAAALVAASSVHIVWAQEARMYTLGTALAVYSAWMLVRALGSGKAVWWVGYALTVAAFLYTHNYALFAVLAQVCFLAGYFFWWHRRHPRALLRSPEVMRACCALGGAALAYLPWVPVMLRQSERVKADYWIEPLRAWTVPNAWCDLFSPHNTGRPPDVWTMTAVFAVLVPVLAALGYKGRAADRLLLLSIVVPVVAAVTISLTVASVVVPRYFLFAHLWALCALARVVCRALAGTERALAVAALLATSLIIHFQYRDELDTGGRPGLRGAIEHVLAHRAADEPIVVLHPALYFAARYHVGDAAPLGLYATAPLSHFNGGPLIVAGDLFDDAVLARLPAARVWTLDSTGFARSFPRFALPNSWQPVPETNKSFAEVYYFQREILAGRFRRK